VKPFSEDKGGLPVWRLQVEDPKGAAVSQLELNFRALDMRHGAIAALVLRLHDGQGRPVIFHQALPVGGPELARIAAAGAFLAHFERHGFLEAAEVRVAARIPDLSALRPTTAEDYESYMAAYRRLGNPEATWAELDAGRKAPKAKAASKAAALLLLLLALAAAAAWYFFLKK